MHEKMTDEELIAACKAHDKEEAAQMGEPSPWEVNKDDIDPEWVSGRVAAMRCAMAALPSGVRVNPLVTDEMVVPRAIFTYASLTGDCDTKAMQDAIESALGTTQAQQNDGVVRGLVEQIRTEANRANDVIRLNRDGGGQGRVKVATAMHRIAKWAETALATQPAHPGADGVEVVAWLISDGDKNNDIVTVDPDRDKARDKHAIPLVRLTDAQLKAAMEHRGEDNHPTPSQAVEMKVVAWLDPVAGEIPLVRLDAAQAEIAAKDAYILTAIAEMEDHKEGYEARVAELEKALEPFAFLADCSEREPVGASVMVNVERCRDARSALHPEREG